MIAAFAAFAQAEGVSQPTAGDERINLTDLRRVALGDRWQGEISIAQNTIRVVTTRKGPADETGARETMTIVARRP